MQAWRCTPGPEPWTPQHFLRCNMAPAAARLAEEQVGERQVAGDVDAPVAAQLGRALELLLCRRQVALRPAWPLLMLMLV